jgi:hypothetical protein
MCLERNGPAQFPRFADPSMPLFAIVAEDLGNAGPAIAIGHPLTLPKRLQPSESARYEDNET